MLFRAIFVSEMMGSAGRTTQSVAEILGAAQRNNRRDEIGATLIFHAGEAALMVEGARTDIDRLIGRLKGDVRHRDLRVLEDRPIVQRRLRHAAQLCALSPEQEGTIMKGRRLSDLSGADLERLLTCQHLRMAA